MKLLPRLAAGLLVAAIAVSPASAAAPRSKVTIRGATVRLSDLFTDLQPGQDCEIGPAPAPGKRIVVPTTQLAAIAAEFGVEWQAGAGYQAVTIERAARLVARDDILALLKPALVAAGAPPASTVSLAAFTSPALPADAAAVPEIQTLDLDPQSGRFSASLLFAIPDAEPVTLRVVGRAEQQVDVVALVHPLPAGAVLMASDLQTIPVRSSSVRGDTVGGVQDAVGLALRRPLADGVPLLRDVLVRPVLVERGRPVVLRLQSAGLTLTAAGTALESGAAGDRVHVVNSLSHAILIGQIMSGADIQIDPGTAPVIMQTNGVQSGLPQFNANSSSGGRRWSGDAQEAQNR